MSGRLLFSPLVPLNSFFIVFFPWLRSSYTVGAQLGPDQPAAAAPAYSQARCMRPLQYGPSDYAISHPPQMLTNDHQAATASTVDADQG